MTAMRQLNKTLFNPALYSRVRDIWFGDLQWGARSANQASMDRWFTAPADERQRFDTICHDAFHPAIESISPSHFSIKNLPDAEVAQPFVSEIESAGEPGGVERTKTALSMLILLDQIPRNLYRTNETLALVYSHYDRLAVALSRNIVSPTPESARLDLHPSIRMSLPYRQWFYLPLMHSEDLADHRRFSAIMDGFKAEAEAAGDKECLAGVENTINFEAMHVDILDKFGRYPHRSECLGRGHTEAEKAWLKEGGQRFGVAG